MTKPKNPSDSDFKFSGFSTPNYTQIPDLVFDELAHRLSGAEYKVLMYILRRTFGFKKGSDDISFNQMLKGIVKEDGSRLDYGAGISSPATLNKAINRLVELEIIIAAKNSSPEKGKEATTYIPNMGQRKTPAIPQESLPTPTTKNEVGATTKNEVALLQKMKIQKTVKQETEQQHVVVANILVEKGIARGVAKKLAKEYPLGYVEEKIAYLEFLLARDPSKVKNPKGWLRRAIEDDYGAPDGFRPAAELEAERAAEEERRRELEAERERERQQREVEEKRQRQREKQDLENAREHYGATEEEQERWQQFLMQMQHMLPAASYAMLSSAELLAIQDKTAIIWARNSMIADLIAGKLKRRLIADLSRLGRAVEDVAVVVMEQWREEVSGAEN